MATQPIADALISVKEYLKSGYEPDREYNEGMLEERNLGEFEHSFLQIFLGTLFINNIASRGVFALTEQRVQLSPRRFVVPDLAVLRMGTPRESILTHPPLIAIEILSPQDKMAVAARKAAEYLRFGVEHGWIIDPKTRTAYRGTDAGLELVPFGQLTVAGTSILVSTTELFAKLDSF